MSEEIRKVIAERRWLNKVSRTSRGDVACGIYREQKEKVKMIVREEIGIYGKKVAGQVRTIWKMINKQNGGGREKVEIRGCTSYNER